MSKSRRQLLFVQTSENTAKRGNECALCHAPHTPLSALMSWINFEAQKLALTDLHLTHQCLVCQPCRDNIGRMVKNLDIKPRWEKGERRVNCCIPMCSNTSFTLSKIASSEQISHIFQCENVHYPTPLCQQHYPLLQNIRQCIWDRIQFENEMIPNNDVLHRHWKRVCWVLDLWAQADRNTIIPKPLSNYGWKVQDNTLAIDWDSDINMDAVKERVEGLLKGCGCKTGCQTWQCQCNAKEKGCGQGCNCTNCTNTHLPIPNVTGSMEEMSVEEIIEDAPPEDLDEIMEWVFGDNEIERVS